MRIALISTVILAIALPARARIWQPIGPPGGDVRSFAADPGDARRIYLGTPDGHIFGSRDGGDHWELLGRAGTRLDGVVSALLVDVRDSESLYASVWNQDPSAGGGVFRSRDGGRTWLASGLTGRAVRALAQSLSHPNVLAAGTLDGVFRTLDGGQSWERISPRANEEIRKIDSVAIDPDDPAVIYAGTFHLPWKTTDGGAHWVSIHEGMIDDSDVMSILVDRAHPQRLYASACSGIYRSENAGALWKKIEGLPYSARRTHVIRQDPQNPSVVYAATTEGLWKTSTAGRDWQRVTPRDWVVNDIVILAGPGNRLVIGTEKLGALVSDDGGGSFRISNDGFYHRQIVWLALDRARPGHILTVLANAPEPILATEDGGTSWAPLTRGLAQQSLPRVYASPRGWLAALEGGGLALYDQSKGAWSRLGKLESEAAAATDTPSGSNRVPRNRSARIEPRSSHARAVSSRKSFLPLNEVVDHVAFGQGIWFASTAIGLLRSTDEGKTWSAVWPFFRVPVRSICVSPDGQNLWMVTMRGLLASTDGGRTWSRKDLPIDTRSVLALDFPPDLPDGLTVLARTRRGLFVTHDAGEHWQIAASGLPEGPVRDLAMSGAIFLVSLETGGLYISYDRGATWARREDQLSEGLFSIGVPHPRSNQISKTFFAASQTEGLFLVDLPARAEVSQQVGRDRTSDKSM